MSNDDKALILIVDDNPQNLQMLGNFLRKAGYRVSAAASGKVALDFLQAHRPACILLDVMMPEMDGFETCRRLKAQETSRDIPVIFITALADITDKLRAFDAGGVDYITKPFQPEEVMARVGAHLQIQALQKNLKTANEALERRNRFIRETFGRYLSDDVVETILESPTGLELGGTKRVVTMLVTDLRGFTSLGEQLPAESVVEMINIYLETMTPIIFNYQGTIDDVLGDAIFALFGAPLARENDVERAIACALEMQIAMTTVNARNHAAGFPAIAIGIGIHTGSVVVGNIGSAQRMKYAVVGRHVNLTFRIESYTVGGQILISEQTRQACRSDLIIAGQQEVMPKGVQSPITIFDVRGIAGEFAVNLPENAAQFATLPQPLPVEIMLLEDKHVSGAAFSGRLVRLAENIAELETPRELEPLNNLKMTLFQADGTVISSELYAKVTKRIADAPPTFSIAFTSLPPDVEAIFAALSH